MNSEVFSSKKHVTRVDVLRCYESSDPATACDTAGGPVSSFTDVRWLEAFRSETVIPSYFRFSAGGETVGVAAGLRTHSHHHLLQSAFRVLCLHTGPVPLNGEPRRATDCFKCLYEYVVKNRYVGLLVGSYDYQYDLHELPFGMNRRTRYEYVLDMSCSLDDLKKKLSRQRRQTINKVNKEGIVVEQADSGSVVDLYKCIQSTKERKSNNGNGNYNPYYTQFLNEVAVGRLLENGMARLYVAKLDGELLSAGLVVSSRERAYKLLGGSTTKGYGLNACSFLDWRIIELLKAEGSKSLNFGGVPPDDSGPKLAQYKRSFGAEKVTRTGSYSYHVQRKSWRDWMFGIYRKIA